MSSPDMNWHAALGLKGTPRLRPHSRENHAHIELRAIEPPEDAADKSGNVLYFSFFTTKAINMKTNKELLVRIAGRFDGRAFIVEGEKGGPEDEPIRPPPDVPEGPARLRKARWSAFSAAELHAKAAVTHADASVQAEPAMAEAVVQTQSPSQVTPTGATQKTSSAVQCNLDELPPAGDRASRKAIISKHRANASSRVSAKVARSMSPLSPLSDLEESDMEVSPPPSHQPSLAPVRRTLDASPAVGQSSASALDPSHGQQRMAIIPLPVRPPSPTVSQATHAPKPLRPTIITNSFVSESISEISAANTPADEPHKAKPEQSQRMDTKSSLPTPSPSIDWLAKPSAPATVQKYRPALAPQASLFQAGHSLPENPTKRRHNRAAKRRNKVAPTAPKALRGSPAYEADDPSLSYRPRRESDGAQLGLSPPRYGASPPPSVSTLPSDFYARASYDRPALISASSSHVPPPYVPERRLSYGQYYLPPAAPSPPPFSAPVAHERRLSYEQSYGPPPVTSPAQYPGFGLTATNAVPIAPSRWDSSVPAEYEQRVSQTNGRSPPRAGWPLPASGAGPSDVMSRWDRVESEETRRRLLFEEYPPPLPSPEVAPPSAVFTSSSNLVPVRPRQNSHTRAEQSFGPPRPPPATYPEPSKVPVIAPPPPPAMIVPFAPGSSNAVPVKASRWKPVVQPLQPDMGPPPPPDTPPPPPSAALSDSANATSVAPSSKWKKVESASPTVVPALPVKSEPPSSPTLSRSSVQEESEWSKMQPVSLLASKRPSNQFEEEGDRLRLSRYSPSAPLPDEVAYATSLHSLPPKPVDPQGKRKREDTSQSGTQKKRKRHMNVGWPTISWRHELDLGVQAKSMSVSQDGTMIAMACVDSSVRVIDAQTKEELIQLDYDSPLLHVEWMDNDSGVVVLTENGVVSKYTRQPMGPIPSLKNSRWLPAVLAQVEMDVSLDSIRFAFWKDRFAVSLPSSGVNIYLWQKGTYQKSRPIVKKNVTCIKFMDEGSMLIGGTKDGSLWQCGVPNGTLCALANVKAVINDVSVDRGGERALVARYGGMCELVNLIQPRRGISVMTFGNEDTIVRPAGGFGCKFLAGGQGALFGNVSGCALVWDTVKGSLVYGLSHEEGDIITCVGAHDGTSASDVGFVITATKRGSLYWWPQPASASPTNM